MGNPAAFTGNASDIHMGPGSVTFNGVNLGYTLNDSLAINVTQTTTPITPDQSSLPIKDYVTGIECNVSMTLGEVNAANLALIPGGDSSGLKNSVGLDMKAIAKELIIVPLDSGDSRVYRFPAASPMLDGPLSFTKNTPQGLQLNFKAYMDSADYYLYFA